MNRPQLIERLALHRQALDQTYRAMLPTEAAPVTWAEAGVALAVFERVQTALDNIAEAVTLIDDPTQTPEVPFIQHQPEAEVQA